MPREDLARITANQLGDANTSASPGNVEAVDPTPDLSRIHAKPVSKPRLAPAIVGQDQLEGGLESRPFHMPPKCMPTPWPLSSYLDKACIPAEMVGQPKLMHELLRELRSERGLSRSKLSRRTVLPGQEGVPEATIEKIEVTPGRVPDAEIIEAIARALEVKPDLFYEYPIAVARRHGREQVAASRLGARLAQEAQRSGGRPEDTGEATRA